MTGLSDVQKRVLELFYQGAADAEIQAELGFGSTSTVRNHRFQLKEKERQARVFLALMELLHEREGSSLDRRQELKRLAKETKPEAGVYKITNNRSGKLFIDTTPNLKTLNGQQFQLESGVHRNKALQQDWNSLGKDAFTIDVLEVLEVPETGYFDVRDALKKLKQKWLEQLQPYGDRGYHNAQETE